MFTIRNISDEDIKVVTHINETAPGCRVANPAPGPMELEPGEQCTFITYEPGVFLTIEPSVEPEKPRIPLVMKVPR